MILTDTSCRRLVKARLINIAPVPSDRHPQPERPLGGPYLHARQQRDFPILDATSYNIPASAQAYSLTSPPYRQMVIVRLSECMAHGADTAPSVNLKCSNWDDDWQRRLLPAGTGGKISTYATNDTDLVVDLDGYFAAPQGSDGLTLYTLSPCRVLDTRQTGGQFSGQLPVDVVILLQRTQHGSSVRHECDSSPARRSGLSDLMG